VCVPMAWAYMPLGLPEVGEILLPTCVSDSRQGFWFWRDGYRGPDDVVFGVYSKATHAGGHVHDDAASMRIDAFGVDWMTGPGQARPQRRGQSVFYPLGDDKNTNRSYFNYFEDRADGFLFSIDLRKASGAYHERLVSVRQSPAPGVDLAMLMLDVVDDHRQRDWMWGWTFARNLTPEVDGDGAGLRLLSACGRVLHLRFLEAKPVEIEIQHLPGSQRTYASGHTERYEGKPLISARFAAEPHLVVLVSAVWSLAKAQRVSGGVHEVELGEVSWTRPFGAALPRNFCPGVSSGPSQNSLS